MEGGQRTNDFSFAPRPGYAVQIRLTPELKQALFHAQTTGQAVSLKLRQDGSNQQATLTIGGQEHFFSTATENNCDVIQLPDPKQPQSDCIAIGCVKQKLNQQRTLNDGIKSRVRASGMEAQLKQKQRQAVLLDKRIQGGVVTKTVTRQVTPPTSVKPPPAPALAQPHAARTAPAVTKRPLEPPKPKSKKPGGGAAVVRGVGSTPPHPSQPTPATSQLNTPVGTPPHGAAAEPAAAAAAAAATVVAAAAAVAAPQQQQQQLQEVPKTAVMAAAKGEAQLCLVAIMMSQPSMSTTMLTKCMDRAYALARQKPEAKEYVKRVLQAACELVPPNRLRLRAEVLARDGPRVEALAAEQAAARTSARSPQASAQEQAGPGSTEKPAKKKREREGTPKLEAAAAATEQVSLRGMQPASAANHAADAAARNLPPKKKRIEAGGRKLLPNGEVVRKKGPSGMPSTASMGDDDFDDLGDVAEPVRRRSGPTGMRSTASIGGSLEELGGSVGAVPRGSSPSGSLRDGPGAAGGKGKKRSREAAVGHATAAAPASQLARNWSSEEEWGAGAAGTSPAGTTTLEENGSDDEGPMVINRKHAKHRKHQHLAAAVASNPARSKDAPEAAAAQNEEAGRGFAWYVMMQEQAERKAAAAAAAAAEEEQLQQQAAARRQQQQQQGPGRVAQQVGSGSIGGDAGSAGSEEGPGIVGPPTTTTSQGPSPGSVNGLNSMAAPGRGAGAAVDAGLDPDDLAYAELEADADLADADAELYRQLAAAAEAGPATVAPISSLEQHRQYEQEYRRKYDVYFKVHQRYNAILREAEGWQDAIATAADEQQRAKWQGELWRYGAKNFRLLRQWQRLATMLQQALQGIRAEVVAYITLLKRRQQEQQEGEQVEGRL